MNEINFTLLSEGSSDQALIPILKWLLEKYFTEFPINSQYADFRSLPQKAKMLEDKILKAFQIYPCNLLFIHRDSDTETLSKREEEIKEAVRNLKSKNLPFFVPVIPVKQLETWLLIDEKAIRYAVGKPNSTIPLNLPKLKNLERKSNPKQFLSEVIKIASELSGTQFKRRFRNTDSCRWRIAEEIEDFSPLQQLSAFQELENKIKNFAESVNQEKRDKK